MQPVSLVKDIVGNSLSFQSQVSVRRQLLFPIRASCGNAARGDLCGGIGQPISLGHLSLHHRLSRLTRTASKQFEHVEVDLRLDHKGLAFRSPNLHC